MHQDLLQLILKWAVDRMMKKLNGVNDKDIFKIALNEAKSITDEDDKVL